MLDSRPDTRLGWSALRALSDKSFFNFVRIVNAAPPGCFPIDKNIHKPLCDFFQSPGTYRKVIAMPRDWLKCVHPDTLVQMADGSEKKISLIEPGDSVVGYDGLKQTTATVAGTHKGIGELYKITFRSGREILCSDRHMFLQVNGYRAMPEYGAYPRGLSTSPVSSISQDEAALIAYFVAEGCLVSGNMSFTNGLKEVQEDFERIVKSFGWSFRKYGNETFNEYRMNGGEGKRYRHNGGPRDWARGHGIWDKSSFEKELPQSIMSAGRDVIRRVIGVLFATDGCVGVYDNYPQACYTSVNKRLCLQVQNLLNRFGVFSEVLFINNEYKGSYCLKVTGKDSFSNFVKEFVVPGKHSQVESLSIWVNSRHSIQDKSAPSLIPDEAKALVTEKSLRRGGVRIDNHYRTSRPKAAKIPSLYHLATSDVCWDNVVSTEKVGPSIVCDITTTSGNYIANGIITHNSTVFTKWGAIWLYLQDNEARILIAAENERLAGRFLHWIQQQLLNNKYLRSMYPELEQVDQNWVRAHRWSASEADLPRNGTYSEPTFTAIGVGGAAQSGHYTQVLIDDLVGKKAKESVLVLESVLRWFDNTPELLVQPHKDMPHPSSIHIHGTFWFPGDFLCYVRDKYQDFEFRVVPCRRRDPKSKFENLVYVQNPEAEIGESNWEQFPTEYYVQMQANPEKNIDYWAQHMNDPEQASELTNFDTDWLRYYRIEERDGKKYIVCEDDKEEFRVGSFPLYGFIDPGGFSDKRLTKTGSRFAIMVGGQPLGTHKKFITYSKAFRFKEPDKALDEIFNANDALKPVVPVAWRQEVYAQQIYILKDVRSEAKKRGIPMRIVELPADENKDSKAGNIDAVKGPMFNGEIYIHRSMKDLISEVQVYPNGMTMDLVDLLGQMNKHVFKRGQKQDTSMPISSRAVYGRSSESRTGY